MKNEQLKLTSQFGIDDIELLDKENQFDGFFKVNKYRFKHRLFAGGWSDVIEREVFERGHAAALLPYDPSTDEVVLIEQLRIPAIESMEQPWLFEIVAGMLDKECENSEEVAKREAYEEAGLTVKRCQYIMNFLSSPGGTSESTDLYIGEVDASTASGIHGLLEEEGEDICVHVVSRETAYGMVCNGQINNAATIIAIQWLQLNVERLQMA